MKKNILLALLCSTSIVWAHDDHWGYEGDLAPQNWGTMNNAHLCSIGQRQSPIDIFDSVADQKLPLIHFHYNPSYITKIVDNGHSLQFNVKQGSTITYNNKVYTLMQFHVHEPAEHTIDGIRYPLELHFVHQAKDGSTLVMAVLVKEGLTNSYFEKLSLYRNLAKAESADVEITLNPENLLPQDKTYYTYQGSLTTPPCTESVIWIVFKQPITMSPTQIQSLALHLPKNNNRPLQPLNGRIVTHN